MTLKVLGAFLVTIGCGGFGFMIAATHRRETAVLRDFIAALDTMECELKYRHTSLPELCRFTAVSSKGVVREILTDLAAELDKQVTPDVGKCMQAILCSRKDIPQLTMSALTLFSQSLGRFDLEGQLKGIETVRSECKQMLGTHMNNQDKRLRCYQTLGVCAGAALAILLI